MKKIYLPERCNYIGVFLTFKCLMNCGYCITKFGEHKPCPEIGLRSWVEALARIPTWPDLPLSLQGGEPTLYRDFYPLVQELSHMGKHLDLLTNGEFNMGTFTSKISPSMFKRPSKYANIRFSFHYKTNLEIMATKAYAMQKMGYRVGIWGVSHPSPEHKARNELMKKRCLELKLDYREKEFLGHYRGELYGTYNYIDACIGHPVKKVNCETSELIIDPMGRYYRCHSDLYAQRNPVGSILDKEFKFPIANECAYYGCCNPCDVKVTTNRHQQYGHTSVIIKGVKGGDKNVDRNRVLNLMTTKILTKQKKLLWRN